LEFSCGGTLVNGDTRIDFYHRDVSKVREWESEWKCEWVNE
jgi:hypothetical protein